ncbi:MAG: FAD/NAD(P)-binding protein [Phycisphaeraceae bacterium]|nr:FAD/NAD(P)-binding protein [Phycisphaeraceae bacterium]MBX3366948.1 FAD/NAD(P)-binding protein [Phycisphaeraceae bacterium]QYK49756.1 MAG: FAD/NAD(P)-binding protein [Phycisphaeraceae bacterium]
MEQKTIAIIGGGCSGVAVATHIAQVGRGALRCVVIECSDKPGTGVAYGTTRPEHLLNVPAGRMSILHDAPGDLVKWLDARGHRYSPNDFVPRVIYGEYLRWHLERVAASGGVRVVRGRCVGIAPCADGLCIALREGAGFVADACVLALGNGAPPRLHEDTSRLRRDGSGLADRVVQNPWAEGAFDRVARDERVVIVGTGLTAVDVVLTLDALAHRGPVTMVSRRGLLPRSHAPARQTVSAWDARSLIVGVSARVALRAVRNACEREMEAGGDWRAVIDSLRPHTIEAWRSWTDVERERFAAHLRPFWDVHRHRMSMGIASRVNHHLASGRLRLVRGSVSAVESDESAGDKVRVVIQSREHDAEHSMNADRVFNCAGPSVNPARWNDPLVESMLASGLAVIDPLGLGFATDMHGRVLDRRGNASGRIFAIGPLRRPDMWESTAVPEIRMQASAIGTSLNHEFFMLQSAEQSSG